MAQRGKQRQASKNDAEMFSWLSSDSQGLNRREMGPHQSLSSAFCRRRKKPTQVRVQAANSVPPPNSGIKCTGYYTAQKACPRNSLWGPGRHPTAGSRVLGVGRMGPPDRHPLPSPLPLTGRTMACQRRNILHILSVVLIKMQFIKG